MRFFFTVLIVASSFSCFADEANCFNALREVRKGIQSYGVKYSESTRRILDAAYYLRDVGVAQRTSVKFTSTAIINSSETLEGDFDNYSRVGNAMLEKLNLKVEELENCILNYYNM